MDAAVLLLAALVLVAAAAFVTVPLRRAAQKEAEADEDPRVADLEARKEAKYREIRDAELDRAAGKLSDEDWRRQDAELRAEAIEILDKLERVRADPSAGRESGH